jgi:heme-degrading monooxygenase HmoA
MNAFKRGLIIGTVGFVVFAPAKAEVLRHAQVVAANEIDYKANIQLIPTFNAMLKKSPGLKAIYVAFDPAKNTFTNTSIWDSAQSVAAVTGSDEWKATVAKLKTSALNIEVLEIQPELSSHN